MALAPYQESLHLHDPQSFWTKYVWSQDHKVIAIQYVITAISVGLVALVLSGLMRLQLGFPGSFSFIDPTAYYQYVTMHGMIMIIYLLTALLLGGFGNFLIPLKGEPIIVIAIVGIAFPVTREANAVWVFFKATVANQFGVQAALDAFVHEFKELAVEKRTDMVFDLACVNG